jgi:hypothetical protein
VFRSTDDPVINDNNGLQGSSSARWGRQSIIDAQYSDGNAEPGSGKSYWGVLAVDGPDADTQGNILNHVRDGELHETDQPNESVGSGTSGNMQVNTWYMAANSYDPVDGIFQTLVTTPDGAGGVRTVVDMATTSAQLTNFNGIGNGQIHLNVALGQLAQATGGSGDWSFDGLVAEVLIYNRALEEADFSAVSEYLNTKYFLSSTNQSGDHDRDGKVDAADFVVWRKNSNGNPDGYTGWRANFGTGSGIGAAQVPEPNALALLALSAMDAIIAIRAPRRFTM